MRVLVTDGDNRASLAITRSLGRAGHEVIVGERHRRSLAGSSRYCAARVRYPDPVRASDEFMTALAEIVRRRAVDVLLPVADITTFLITRNRARFESSCRIPFADAHVIERAADKVGLLALAERLGLPVPQHVLVTSPDAIPSTDLGFPLVIKPWRSRIQTSAGWISTSVGYADDRKALVRDLRSRAPHEFPIMLQERIEGPGVGVFACYERGRAVALFSHRRLRERPPWGGVSVLSESTALCPQARDFAVRLLDALGWQGVAMVEFKRDRRDDVPKLMEINGRFWGSLQLAVDAGVDFPRILVEEGTAGSVSPDYRVGVRNRWLWGDLDSLLLSLFGAGRAPAGVRPSRLSAIGEFLRFRGPDLFYENPKWDDLKPWAFETYCWFRRAARDATAPAAHKRPVAATERTQAPAVRLALRSTISTSLDATGLDEAAWNALVARSGTRSVFQTYQWTRAWWTVFQGRREPVFVTASEGGRPVAVAPLVMERRVAGNVVRFVGDGRADYCDFVMPAERPDALAAIFDALADDRRWDVLELNNVPSRSATPELLRAVCGRRGYHTLTDDLYLCPTLLIAGHLDEARGIFNKASLRRRENYYQRAGRLVTRDLTRHEEIEPYLDEFFAQHVSRWRDAPKPSLFLEEGNRRFYRELTRAFSGTGWLLFSAIEIDERPIAFHYGFDYDGSVLWYKPTFDPEEERHSPGLVMVRHLIGYAITHGRRELDFTLGDEAFKRRFTNATRHTVRVQVFRDPARYLLERSRRRAIDAMKKVWS